MRLTLAKVASRWNWWWGFGLLIGVPAMALAILGLRAARTERIERERQLVEQRAQLARVADSALSTHFAELVQQLYNQHAANEANIVGGFTPLSIDRRGRLTFIRDRVYSTDTDEQTEWPEAIERLIEQAQAAQARQRTREAAGLYRRIRDVEPRLRDWAELSAARMGFENSDAAAREVMVSARWSKSPGLTPSGLPVALIACSYSDGPPVDQRSGFVPLLEQTLQALRSGQWWLSYEQRAIYDQDLRRRLEAARADVRLTEDARLGQLAAIDRVVRNSPPVHRDVVTNAFDRGSNGVWLIIWSPDRGSNSRLGLAISELELEELLDGILKPLLARVPARAAVRDDKGDNLWGELSEVSQVEPLRVVSAWELAFSSPVDAGWSDQKQLLWFGFVLLLVVTLLAGVGITIWVVRREAELALMQNEFIAGVTHEFKSPITSIRLLMERLASGRLQSPEAAGEYQSAIEREIDRLDRHVDRLLEAQKIQEGRREYHFAPVSLVDVVRRAVQDLEPQASARGIGLELRLDAQVPELVVDRAAVTDAVENLLDNAIKYSASGKGVSVAVSVTENDVCLEVRDEGIGIDLTDLPRIFDKFYRGRRGHQHSARGTGLGLALVKATVEAHGGTIEAASKPGEGSTFSIRLPMNRAMERD